MLRVGGGLIRGGACWPVGSGRGIVKAQDGGGVAALQYNAAMVIHALTTWNALQWQPQCQGTQVHYKQKSQQKHALRTRDFAQLPGIERKMVARSSHKSLLKMIQVNTIA
jgi:hypothetical protein